MFLGEPNGGDIISLMKNASVCVCVCSDIHPHICTEHTFNIQIDGRDFINPSGFTFGEISLLINIQYRDFFTWRFIANAKRKLSRRGVKYDLNSTPQTTTE